MDSGDASLHLLFISGSTKMVMIFYNIIYIYKISFHKLLHLLLPRMVRIICFLPIDIFTYKLSAKAGENRTMMITAAVTGLLYLIS